LNGFDYRGHGLLLSIPQGSINKYVCSICGATTILILKVKESLLASVSISSIAMSYSNSSVLAYRALLK